MAAAVVDAGDSGFHCGQSLLDDELLSDELLELLSDELLFSHELLAPPPPKSPPPPDAKVLALHVGGRQSSAASGMLALRFCHIRCLSR
jgi:hypothetical protein